jgi:glycosyltransferase involved in cell wall biosynthesis
MSEIRDASGHSGVFVSGRVSFPAFLIEDISLAVSGDRLFKASRLDRIDASSEEFSFDCLIENARPPFKSLIAQVDVVDIGRILQTVSCIDAESVLKSVSPERFTRGSASLEKLASLQQQAMGILGAAPLEESVLSLARSASTFAERSKIPNSYFLSDASLCDSLLTNGGDDYLSSVPNYLSKRRDESWQQYMHSLSLESDTKLAKRYPYYPDFVQEDSELGKPMRICIVTMDFPGPARTGGIGTWALSLAELLVEQGHEVKIAYIRFENGSNMRVGTEKLWKQYFKSRGIHFSVVPRQPLIIENSHVARMSFDAFAWLREQDFDFIHFHEMVGYAFYSVMAKRQGLAFPNTTLCVGIHSPDRWHALENRSFSTDKIQLEIDFMEKRSVECADVAFSPSEYLLNWAQGRGWSLPDRSYVIPHPLPATLQEREPRTVTESVEELVFFGRLESRKGLEVFCEAIEILDVDIPVTFLGTEGRAAGLPALSYLRQRAAKWTAPVKYLTDYDHINALDYIQREGVLCVVPSLSDSTSYTLCECLHLGVPVIASSWAGMGEAVAVEDRDRILVEPIAQPLASKIQACINGQSAIAKPRVSHIGAKETWLRFHQVEHSEVTDEWREFESDNPPLISVCIPHRNRPSVLERALKSVRSQDYPKVEVVIVDDGSTIPGVAEELRKIERDFSDLSARLVSQPQRYPGAARNMAAAHAKGEYLFFLDDDNLMKPNALSVLYQAVSKTGADIMTAALDIFVGDSIPDAPIARMLFLGGNASASVVSNTLGDTFALIARKTFLELGGFTEDKYTNHEDWELLARAVIYGKSVQHCPEALGWYRYSPEGFLHRSDSYANLLRSTRAYIENAPSFTKDLFHLFHGLQKRLASKFESNVSLAHMPQDVLRKRFLFSSRTILRLDGSTGFADLTPTSEIDVETTKPGMLFYSTGRDPQLLLPEFSLPRNRPICMRLNIISTAATVCQLFYRVEGMDHFSETHQTQIGLTEGSNVVFLGIERADFIGALRLDPAGLPGKFEIRHIEIRVL